MSLINIGLVQGVSTVAGTPGQITVNGQYAPVNGNVTIALDGGLTGATGIYNTIYGGDTNLSGSLVSMSGQLVTQIQSAAGVLSLNGATGFLTLTSAPANANYVKITTSGTTIMVSGDTTPLLSGISLPGGAQVSGDRGVLYLFAAGGSGVRYANSTTMDWGSSATSIQGVDGSLIDIKGNNVLTTRFGSVITVGTTTNSNKGSSGTLGYDCTSPSATTHTI